MERTFCIEWRGLHQTTPALLPASLHSNIFPSLCFSQDTKTITKLINKHSFHSPQTEVGVQTVMSSVLYCMWPSSRKQQATALHGEAKASLLIVIALGKLELSIAIIKGNKHVGTHTAEDQAVERNPHNFGCNTLRQVAGWNLYQRGRRSAKSLTSVVFIWALSLSTAQETNTLWPGMGLHACTCQNDRLSSQPELLLLL